MSSHLKIITKGSLKELIRNVATFHSGGGFKVKRIDADLKFECVEDNIEEDTVGVCGIDD